MGIKISNIKREEARTEVTLISHFAPERSFHLFVCGNGEKKVCFADEITDSGRFVKLKMQVSTSQRVEVEASITLCEFLQNQGLGVELGQRIMLQLKNVDGGAYLPAKNNVRQFEKKTSQEIHLETPTELFSTHREEFGAKTSCEAAVSVIDAAKSASSRQIKNCFCFGFKDGSFLCGEASLLQNESVKLKDILLNRDDLFRAFSHRHSIENSSLLRASRVSKLVSQRHNGSQKLSLLEQSSRLTDPSLLKSELMSVSGATAGVAVQELNGGGRCLKKSKIIRALATRLRGEGVALSRRQIPVSPLAAADESVEATSHDDSLRLSTIDEAKAAIRATQQSFNRFFAQINKFERVQAFGGELRGSSELFKSLTFRSTHDNIDTSDLADSEKRRFLPFTASELSAERGENARSSYRGRSVKSGLQSAFPAFLS